MDKKNFGLSLGERKKENKRKDTPWGMKSQKSTLFPSPTFEQEQEGFVAGKTEAYELIHEIYMEKDGDPVDRLAVLWVRDHGIPMYDYIMEVKKDCPGENWKHFLGNVTTAFAILFSSNLGFLALNFVRPELRKGWFRIMRLIVLKTIDDTERQVEMAERKLADAGK